METFTSNNCFFKLSHIKAGLQIVIRIQWILISRKASCHVASPGACNAFYHACTATQFILVNMWRKKKSSLKYQQMNRVHSGQNRVISIHYSSDKEENSFSASLLSFSCQTSGNPLKVNLFKSSIHSSRRH